MSAITDIAISCDNVLDKDITSKSDPMAVVFKFNSQGNNYGGGGRKLKHLWTEIGRTEQIRNNLNPRFSTRISIPYSLHQDEYIKIQVFDIDSRSPNLNRHDKLGSAEFRLQDLLASGQLRLPLHIPKIFSRGATHGSVTIVNESTGFNDGLVSLQFQARNLDHKDFFSKSDPYLEVWKPLNTNASVVDSSLSNTNVVLVHRTEFIKDNSNPMWRPFNVNLSKLNNGNYNLPLVFRCYDHDTHSRPDLIGTCSASLNQLMQNLTSGSGIPLTGNRTGKTAGVLYVSSCVVQKSSNKANYGGQQASWGSSHPNKHQQSFPPQQSQYGHGSNSFSSFPQQPPQQNMYGGQPPQQSVYGGQQPLAQNMYGGQPPPTQQQNMYGGQYQPGAPMPTSYGQPYGQAPPMQGQPQPYAQGPPQPYNQPPLNNYGHPPASFGGPQPPQPQPYGQMPPPQAYGQPQPYAYSGQNYPSAPPPHDQGMGQNMFPHPQQGNNSGIGFEQFNCR